MPLTGQRILIVEDEALIAMELVDIVEIAGGRVVGPVRTNWEALLLVEDESVDAVLLDLNLADGDATPVATVLMGRAVPVVICTAGIVPPRLRQAFPDIPVHRKPVKERRLVACLSDAIAARRPRAPYQAACGDEMHPAAAI